jgi:drug/metabolite transporter (DMT)-like permease
VSEAPFQVEPAARRRPQLGYAMAAGAAALWGVNGSVSKVILDSGVSSLRLTEVRCTGAFLGLVLILLVTGPTRLRVRARELPFLALFGIGGLAFVQWFYFLAIDRLVIGIALLVQYLAPLLVALWARYVFQEPVRRRIWLALALALVGLALIVDVRQGGTVSTAGVLFAALAAATYTLYMLLAEHKVSSRGAVPLLAWGFGFAALFFAVIAPWWSFPGHRVGADVSLLGHLSDRHLPVWALMTSLVLLGTIVPFFLLVSALRHLPAVRVGIIAMLEPVVATVVAWVWLDETLGAVQLVGGVIVLAAIVVAQTAR